jgi:rhamnogalacturonyl hydrolase YesR
MRELSIHAISRRQFLRVTAAGAALPWLAQNSDLFGAMPADKFPAALPPGVPGIITETLRRPPASLNTDWFGTMLMEGVLKWSRRGVGDAHALADAWFEVHASADAVSEYSGPKSRIVRAGGIPITTYVGHFGLAMPCYEMATQFRHAQARQACSDIGEIIIRQTTRDRLGLIDHFDGADFAIPDTCYFVVTPLMLAAELDEKNRERFRDEALQQLRLYTDTFLVPETGLAKTILLKDGLGKTYWTRASGWLLWGMTVALRYLPITDPRRPPVLRDLERLANGLSRVQDKSGGFRVLLDDPSTPLESTGGAMIAGGLHEAVRRGWLPDSYNEMISRAWNFVTPHITPEGNIRQAYTGWARPAEERKMIMEYKKQEWVNGLILLMADEMTTA